MSKFAMETEISSLSSNPRGDDDKDPLLPHVIPASSSPSANNGNNKYSQASAVISCLFYSLCSVAMVLTNKGISTAVPSHIKPDLPQLSIIMFQCIIAVGFVEIAKMMRAIEYPAFNIQHAKPLVPLNALFIGMLLSGFLSLVYVSVPIVTVFKNLTNLVTVAGDWYLFKEEVSMLTIISLAIMAIGAILAGANDLQFSSIGYFWMAVNCLCTSSYTLCMRYVGSNIQLPRFGMVFYNNLLSIIFLLPFCILKGEYVMWSNKEMFTSQFIVLNFLAGLFGCGLNFASLWCVTATSATTYAIVGSVNKVPITILGFVFYSVRMTREGIVFIVMATLGGFVYAYSKLPKKK